uniref:Uncharacterized protein n=1 Tax=Trichogramma kaykai TaxID=54128 RepID=A0ABD2XI83_9HYME
MESNEDVIRIKEETNDVRPDAGDDYIFDLVNSYETKSFETFTFDKSSVNNMNESMPLQRKLHKEIFIDYECEDVKSELKSLITICKTDVTFVTNHLDTRIDSQVT